MEPAQIKILIIDPNLQDLERHKLILERELYNVDVTTEPREAKEKISKDSYHLVITEAQFPDGSKGTDIIRFAKDVKVQTCGMILTSRPTLEDAIEAVKVDACDYLIKPVESDKLLKAIKCSLSKRGIFIISDETINKTIGARIRQLRRERGLTTQQLAEKVGVTQSQISQIETGKSAASIVTLFRLARALGMSLSEALEGI